MGKLVINGKEIHHEFNHNGKKVVKLINHQNKKVLVLTPKQKTQYRNEYTVSEHPTHTEYRNKYITTTTENKPDPSCDYYDQQMGICSGFTTIKHNHDNYTKWYRTAAEANAEHSGTLETKNVDDGVQTHIHHTAWFDAQAEADAVHAGTSQTRQVPPNTPSGTQGADK